MVLASLVYCEEGKGTDTAQEKSREIISFLRLGVGSDAAHRHDSMVHSDDTKATIRGQAGQELAFAVQEKFRWTLHDAIQAESHGDHQDENTHGRGSSGEDGMVQSKNSRRMLSHGESGAEKTISFTITRSGKYSLRALPSALGNPFSTTHFSITVESGFTYAPHSVVCYFPPFDGLRPGADIRAFQFESLSSQECVPLSPNVTAPFRRDASPDNNLTVWNTGFSLCQKRICVTLQVRRYDAWGNKVQTAPAGIEDVISAELGGVESAVVRSDLYGNGTLVYSTDSSTSKYETWMLSSEGASLGDVKCSSFRCPMNKIVGPDSFVNTWITVRINGVPAGIGNPVFVRTVPGNFFSFGLDATSINGSITPPGTAFAGPEIRLFPADKGGLRLPEVFPGACRADMQVLQSQVGMLNKQWCRPEAMLHISGVSIKALCFEDLDNRTTAIENITSSNDLNSLVDFVLRPRDNCTRAGCDDLPQTSLPASCMYCEWIDIEHVFITQVSTITGAICKLTLSYASPLVPGQVVPVSTPVSFFKGNQLAQGEHVMRISAGNPSPITSSMHGLHANVSMINGSIYTQNDTIRANIVLRDAYGNANSNGDSGFRAMLRRENFERTLAPPEFHPETSLWNIRANVTVAGLYTVHILLLPRYDGIWGSPFRMFVHPDLPLAAHTLLIGFEPTTIIDIPGPFYLQARDRYMNLVSSSISPYFKENLFPFVPATNRAPGFWIWAKPLNSTIEPILDTSGANFLRCPDMCGGTDPGYGALKVAFRPTVGGVYAIKLQYCDPAVNGYGPGACLDTAAAYDITAMQPPQIPNPCNAARPGEPGAPRRGYACEIGPHVSYLLTATTDRIIDLRSTMQIPSGMRIGNTYLIRVIPRDRFSRPAARITTICEYMVESFEVRRGKCLLNPIEGTMYFYFTPEASGPYYISAFLDGFKTSDSPTTNLFIAADYRDFDGYMSTAHGQGLSLAAVGVENTFSIYLRDQNGVAITRGYYTPLQGVPFFEDCGYPQPTLSDGVPTSGYGLVGDNINGFGALPHGCRYGFHVYVVDSSRRILRPARGFTVTNIQQIPDGSVSVSYTIAEPGEHLMYARYLPYDNAGQILHNASGRLSLESRSTSREGQIRGSPFTIKVLPSEPDALYSYAEGPGVLSGVVNASDWTRFDIVSRDIHGNLAPCRANEMLVTITDPSERTLSSISITDGTDLQTACHVSYLTTETGIHRVSVTLHGKPIPGSPFFPQIYLSAGPPADGTSHMQMITRQTPFPCHEEASTKAQNPGQEDDCDQFVDAGEPFVVHISARDASGSLPDDVMATFPITVGSKRYMTVREERGEHSVRIVMTASGRYTVAGYLNGLPLNVLPWGTTTASIRVLPARADPLACSLDGDGLTAAIAGQRSTFSIIARDRYGNLAATRASASPWEFLPGRSMFQVSIRGDPLNITVYAAVTEQAADSTYAVSYTLTVAGRYSLRVTLLDEPPLPLVTNYAVYRSGLWQTSFDRIISRDDGANVSSYPQPWMVIVRSDVPKALSRVECTSSCCGAGSFAYLKVCFL